MPQQNHDSGSFDATLFPYDPVPSDAVAEIAHTGRCYTNEARALAREVLERRAAAAPAEFNWVLG